MSDHKINVCEIRQWQCLNCGTYNDGPSWLRRGDTVRCEKCKKQYVVDLHYVEHRPKKFEGKKAT